MRHAFTLAALALLLAACGSDDTDGGPADPPSTSASSTEAAETSSAAADTPSSSAAVDDEQAITDQFFAYNDAFFTGDGAAAYAILSSRCQDVSALSEFAAATEQAAEVYGKLEPTIDAIRVDGDRASVDATWGVPAIDDAVDDGQEYNWVREDGVWRADRCG